jgi:hypothetical protein
MVRAGFRQRGGGLPNRSYGNGGCAVGAAPFLVVILSGAKDLLLGAMSSEVSRAPVDARARRRFFVAKSAPQNDGQRRVVDVVAVVVTIRD